MFNINIYSSPLHSCSHDDVQPPSAHLRWCGVDIADRWRAHIATMSNVFQDFSVNPSFGSQNGVSSICRLDSISGHFVNGPNFQKSKVFRHWIMHLRVWSEPGWQKYVGSPNGQVSSAKKTYTLLGGFGKSNLTEKDFCTRHTKTQGPCSSLQFHTITK